MRPIRATILLLLAASFWAAPILSVARADHYHSHYAAIAYSQSTGRYGYAHGYHGRCAAENEALSHCTAAGARIVVWSRNNWCVLALGDDKASYGYAWGGCREDVKSDALYHCRQRTTNCYIAVCVY